MVTIRKLTQSARLHVFVLSFIDYSLYFCILIYKVGRIGYEEFGNIDRGWHEC